MSWSIFLLRQLTESSGGTENPTMRHAPLLFPVSSLTRLHTCAIRKNTQQTSVALPDFSPSPTNSAPANYRSRTRWDPLRPARPRQHPLDGDQTPSTRRSFPQRKQTAKQTRKGTSTSYDIALHERNSYHGSLHARATPSLKK